jgi:hypothetical protein
LAPSATVKSECVLIHFSERNGCIFSNCVKYRSCCMLMEILRSLETSMQVSDIPYSHDIDLALRVRDLEAITHDFGQAHSQRSSNQTAHGRRWVVVLATD